MDYEALIRSFYQPFAQVKEEPVRRVASGSRAVPDNIVDCIIKFERMHKIGKDGLVYPYHDAIGLPTIGVGHLLSNIKGDDLTKYEPLTQEDARELLNRDLDKFANGVSRLVKVHLNDNEFGALVSLAFNIGLGNLKISSLLRKLNRGDSRNEVALEFLKWNKAAGRILRGLTIRRNAEMQIFLTPV